MIGSKKMVKSFMKRVVTDERGLTLVETLVSTAIIAVVMILAANIIILFFETDRQATDELTLEGVGRDLLAHVVESSRTAYIDYDYYASVPLPVEESQLALRHLSGEQTTYWFYGSVLYICVVGPDASCPNGGDPSVDAEWDQLSPSAAALNGGGFLIRPSIAPYISYSAIPPDDAPFVTIRFSMEGEQVDTPILQTSFTPRLYVR